MEDLIKRLTRYSDQCIAERLDYDFAEAVIDTIEVLKALIPYKKLNGQELVPLRHERWSLKGGNQREQLYECTYCGRIVGAMSSAIYKYCPECGSRMDGRA